MKRIRGIEWAMVCIGVVVLLVTLFYPVFFKGKILFPSNLLVTAYAPWRYEPVPEYPNGPPNKPMGFDNIRQFFPNRKLLSEEFAKGSLPLWNPYIYAGTPFMAAFDTAVFYPLSWIAALLPTIDGWNFLVISMPLLSLIFMYLFLRSSKFSMSVSLFGAIAYTLSGWLVVYWQEILVLEHSFLWLPLALYASNRLWDRHSDMIGFLALIVALTSSILGGFLQMSIYVYGIVLIWNLFSYAVRRGERNRGTTLRRISGAILASLLLSSIQLIPSMQAFFLSPRGLDEGSSVFQNNLLPLQHLVTLLAPDFWGNSASYNYFGGSGFYFEKMIYIGIIPLLFALYAVVSKKTSEITFWTLVAVASLSLGFALPTSWLPYYLRIPVLSNSYPTRIFSVWTLSAVILACHGLESFLKNQNRKRMVWILVGMTLVLTAAWAVVASMWCTVVLACRGKISVVWHLIALLPIINQAVHYASISLRNLFIPTLFVVSAWGLILVFKFSKTFGLLVVYGLTIVSGLYFAQKYIFFSDRRFVYPDLPVIEKLNELAGYDRVWGYGNAFIEKNLPQYYRWFSSDGYGNLSPQRYAEVLSTIANNGKLGGLIRRSDTDIYEASEWDALGTVNPYRLRIMSLLGVKYILESKRGEYKERVPTEKRFPSNLFVLAWEDTTWRIWRYKESLPRAVFASTYKVVETDQELVDALYDPATNLEETVLLEQEPGMKITQHSIKGERSVATIESYTPNTVVVSTLSPTDGFVLLTDNYYPGWKATVDGKPSEILRADFAFRAVAVPKGKHSVVFSYFPVTLSIGGIVTAIGVCVMSIVLIRNRGK